MNKTKFFEFSQNNSGGSFVIDVMSGIGHHVIIEAVDVDHANSIAESIGIYFDGCANGIDCDCCGDRWYPAYGEGDDVPSSYGQPLTEVIAQHKNYYWEDQQFFVHYLHGQLEEIVLLKEPT